MPNTEQQILLLCENDASAQLDRRAIREAGYPRITLMTSGVDAARLLAGLEKSDEDFSAVVCSQKLSDMDGDQFCAIIRQHPLLLALPVLLVLPSDSEAEQLRTLGCGASALLGRPYSVDDLKKQLDLLCQNNPFRSRLREGAAKIDTSAFDSALATYGILLRPSREPEDYFRVGMRCLEEHRWNHAINAFRLALSNAQIKAEAELGMAAAFKGKGDQQRFKGWLARAAETLVLAKRWHLARTAYARLLQHDPDAKNPFLARAHQLIRLKNYDDAANTLVESLSVMRSARAGDKFARICFTADDPAAMFSALENSLSIEGGQKASDLNEEIKRSLEVLNKERAERQRQMSVERKWQLARAMAEKKKSETPRSSPESGEKTSLENNLKEHNLFVKDFQEDDIDTPGPVETNEELEDIEELEDRENTGIEQPVLAPLSQNDLTSDMFSEKPRFNELLSVVKLTWKLARKSGKK